MIGEWKRYKRITNLPESEFADQLYQCCERPLARLLLKENPNIIEEGEKALTEAIKKMAVLQVAVSVRRSKLLSTKQEPGQLFREFFANVRASASTCDYSVPCPHACCRENETIDYTSRVVKDILVAGIVDDDIRKDVLGHARLDSLTDKDIVAFVEEKEMAKNACDATGRSDVNGVSAYRKQSRENNRNSNNSNNSNNSSNNSNYSNNNNNNSNNNSNNSNSNNNNMNARQKLALKGTCSKCGSEINLYTRYRSGKMNKDPFQTCIACFRIDRDSPKSKGREIENSAVSNFIESMSYYDRHRADTDPL